MPQTIADVMTALPTSLPPSASLADAARCMRDQAIGDVLVVDGDTLVGLVTDRDIVVRGLASGFDPSAPVAEVCTPNPVTVAPGDSIDEAVRLMSERAVRRLPVVADGRAVGIVAIGDLALERDPSSVLADISGAEPSR